MEKLTSFSQLPKILENEEPEIFDVHRREVYMLDLSDLSTGTIHITNKSRPGVIISNDKGNGSSGCVIVALITSSDRNYPMHYKFRLQDQISTIKFEQILTIDKERIKYKMGELTPKEMHEAEKCLSVALGMERYNLYNLQGIEVINRMQIKTRFGEETSFTVNISFTDGFIQAQIPIDKMQEYNKDIQFETDFEKIRTILDCCKGLSFISNYYLDYMLPQVA